MGDGRVARNSAVLTYRCRLRSSNLARLALAHARSALFPFPAASPMNGGLAALSRMLAPPRFPGGFFRGLLLRRGASRALHLVLVTRPACAASWRSRRRRMS